MIPGIVDAKDKMRNQGHNHQGHETLYIQAVPHMGPAGGDIGRRKENRFDGLKKRI